MKCLETLQKRISEKNDLEIQAESGFLTHGEFKWNIGVSDAAIEEFEKNISYKLPKDYIEFLKTTNGAILFRDKKYGQWGYNFLEIEKIIDVTKEKREIGYEIPASCIVIATCFGDGDIILIDLDKSSKNEKCIIDGDQGYQCDRWRGITKHFEKFIDRLIVAQGAKYWRWY